jgi:hypothetical protein
MRGLGEVCREIYRVRRIRARRICTPGQGVGRSELSDAQMRACMATRSTESKRRVIAAMEAVGVDEDRLLTLYPELIPDNQRH